MKNTSQIYLRMIFLITEKIILIKIKRLLEFYENS